jgi:hypothetical protein
MYQDKLGRDCLDVKLYQLLFLRIEIKMLVLLMILRAYRILICMGSCSSSATRVLRHEARALDLNCHPHQSRHKLPSLDIAIPL